MENANMPDNKLTEEWEADYLRRNPVPLSQPSPEDKPEESGEEYYQRKDTEIIAPRLHDEIKTLNGMLEVQQKTLEMFRDEKASLKDQLVACKSELEQSRKAIQEQTELRWPTDEQIRKEFERFEKYDLPMIRHKVKETWNACANWLKQQTGNNQ